MCYLGDGGIIVSHLGLKVVFPQTGRGPSAAERILLVSWSSDFCPVTPVRG